jgi:release factor glutamine methyltransferase
VAGALECAAARLRAAGVPSAEWDAERLLRHLLGLDRAQLLTRGRDRLSAPHTERYLELITKRAARQPLQYLVGTQEFWRRDFVVTPAVLIPRPETELIVEAALELLRDVRRPVIVDVGTGSGCIAITLAAERPDAIVHATDISPAALEVARENARRLGVEGRIRFHEGDLLEPVADLAGAVDLIASNPPYVELAELAALQPEVRDHEPRIALVLAEGTRHFYGRLLGAAARILRPKGIIAVEVGQGQARDVAELAVHAGIEVTRLLPDPQGILRVVVGRRDRTRLRGLRSRRRAPGAPHRRDSDRTGRPPPAR